MKILGIESTCDETAAAVVENGKEVLSSVISSQAKLHEKTGGVVPEVAARKHLPAIIPVIKEALAKADLKWEDIDAIAVSECPGLLGSLLIGCVTAQFLAFLKDKKLIPVNHVVGHLYSVYLENPNELKFPRLILTVSGGHNEIVLMKNHFDFEILGSTLDDSAGEAFDKAARLMGLGYPGGPQIQKAAELGKEGEFQLPRPMINQDSLNMSFSGLKTALLYEMKKKKISEDKISSLALEFQNAVVDVLVAKIKKAVEKNPEIKEVHLVGGVSANKVLRLKLKTLSETFNLPIYYPENISFCTDNAAMIASAAYFQTLEFPNKYSSETKLNIKPNSSIEDYFK